MRQGSLRTRDSQVDRRALRYDESNVPRSNAVNQTITAVPTTPHHTALKWIATAMAVVVARTANFFTEVVNTQRH
jgi:hypothetical protein